MADERMSLVDARIAESIAVKSAWSGELKERIIQTADAIVNAAAAGGRLLLAGNGGSAADAQHFACELVGRFLKERKALDASALTTNSSTLTALLNDYPPELIYARQVEAVARRGDVLVAISTSGNSPNILKAIEAARLAGVMVIGMTGETGGSMAASCDILLNFPSRKTPRIQESHVLAMHIICELVEEKL